MRIWAATTWTARSLSILRASLRARTARTCAAARVHWGGFSVVKAELALLRAALRDARNERFLLVSESCAPVHALRCTYAYLFSTERSFVAHWNTTDRRDLYRFPARAANASGAEADPCPPVAPRNPPPVHEEEARVLPRGRAPEDDARAAAPVRAAGRLGLHPVGLDVVA